MEMNESIQMILARVFVSDSWLSSEITPPYRFVNFNIG